MIARALALLALVSGCAATQKLAVSADQTTVGQLFCAVQVNGGGALVVGLVDAAASAAVPSASPVAVVATGMAKARVDADCALAGTSAGGSGIAVSPPANPAAAPQVAVVAK